MNEDIYGTVVTRITPLEYWLDQCGDRNVHMRTLNDTLDLRQIASAVDLIDRQMDILDPSNPFEASEIERKAAQLRELIALLEFGGAPSKGRVTLVASRS